MRWIGVYMAIAGSVCVMAQAAGMTAALKPEVLLSSPRYTLADVATLHCEGVPDCPSIGGLFIGTAPAIDAKEVLSLDQLRLRLNKIQAGLVKRIAWRGAAAVQIRTASQQVALDQLGEKVSATLKASYGAEAEIAVDLPESTLKLPVGAVSFGISRPDFPARDRLQIPVRVMVDGRFQRLLNVPVRMQLPRTVWVAARDIAAGTKLSCADWKRETLDTAKLPGLATQDVCQGAWRIRRAVAAGMPLTAVALETMPEVSQGEAVKLMARSGGIQIESQAIALADGRRGEVIAVRPAHATASIRARVAGMGELQAIGME